MPQKGKQKGSEATRKHRPVRPPRSLDVAPDERRRIEDRRDAALSLESRFCRLPADLAEYWRSSLVQEPFARPLPLSAAILLREKVDGSPDAAPLDCPRRPKWRHDSGKLYVEKNEQALFAKWLAKLDEGIDEIDEPTFVERNLDVWRQLWRVGESSDILCVLADIRAPLLHLPGSLLDYLRGLKPARPVLLVLTKCDLVPETVVDAWRRYLAHEYPDFRVVCIESYLDYDARRPCGSCASGPNFRLMHYQYRGPARTSELPSSPLSGTSTRPYARHIRASPRIRRSSRFGSLACTATLIGRA
jgi:hypothetical protein